MATVINIFGSGRSGTTMLDVMLGNAPDAFSCGEVVNWFRPMRTHSYSLKANLPQHGEPCTIWDKLKDAPANQFHTTVAVNAKANFVIDSSKPLCWVLDTQKWTAATNLKIFNLLMWKNPVDMAYSRWKRGDKNLSKWRAGFVKYYSKVIEVDLPFFAVNYNDLISDPPRKLAEICSAIDMPYFEGKERFWEKKHCHLFGSLGIRRQIEAGNSIIEAKKSFPPEFNMLIEDLTKNLAADSKLCQILEVLRKNDVSLCSNQYFTGHQFQNRNLFPWWYYAKKLKRALQRYCPKEFDPFAREALETVPLRDHSKELIN